MRYISAKLNKEVADMVYREYITESIRLRNEGQYLNFKYLDTIYKEPEREHDAQAMVNDFVSRAGIEVKSYELT